MGDIWDQIQTSIENYAPQVLGAAVILVVGWLVAWLVSRVVRHALERTDLDERLGRSLGSQELSSTEESAGRIAFWVIMLLAIVAALETLEFEAVTEPLSDVVSTLLGFIPNLIAAGVILLVGYVIARMLRTVVENLADAMGVNRVGERAGLAADGPRLSATLGLIVFALVLIPTIVAALNALRIDAVAEPTSNMLDDMLAAVPGIVAAALLLVIAYLVARIVAPLVVSILTGLGFNSIPQRLGMDPGQDRVVGRTAADLVGALIVAVIMLVAALEAAELVGFVALAVLISGFMVYFGQILVGLVIIGIGFWLANIVAMAIRASGTAQAGLLAHVGRVAVIVLAFAIGLGEMGIAEEIVILAFGLPLAAVALGLAIGLGVALGIGGRDVAARELENVRRNLRSDQGV